MKRSDDELLQALPARVLGVEVQDPVLVLFGDDWSLTVACPWEGNVGGIGLSWEDRELEDRAWDLVGQDLVAVRQQAGSVRFEFSAATLVATPDTDLDPWVLRLPGGLMVGRLR